MPSILVFGHKNPDNDAISAAIGYAYLKNELAKKNGEDVTYEAVRLGGLPPETEWILSENGIETPRLIEGVGEGDKVILVDHSEALPRASRMPRSSKSSTTIAWAALPPRSRCATTPCLLARPARSLLVSSTSRALKCLRLSPLCCWAPCSPTR